MSMEPPEVHTPHKGHGANWLEVTISVAALVTSAVSIFIAVRHGEVMEKLVEANSLPFLSLYSGNYVDGRNVSHFTLRNDGVGPARVMSLRVSLNGRPVRSMGDLLAACCAGRSPSTGLVTSNAYSRFIPARGESELFAYARPPEVDPEQSLWRAFDRARGQLKVEACYCSVFEDCYVMQPAAAEARRVKSCPVDRGADFTP